MASAGLHMRATMLRAPQPFPAARLHTMEPRCRQMSTRVHAQHPGNPYGEEAPGTGRRHAPWPQDSPTEDPHSDDEQFEMRSTAEVYQLFEELQRRQISGAEAAPQQAVTLPPGYEDLSQGNFGPGAGHKRRPSVVSSHSGDEDVAPNQFQMMSTAQVVALWEKMQRRQGGGVAGPPQPGAPDQIATEGNSSSSE
mmetsp:Transcript_18298/g.55065  ORF Transcript_18298/g.55065 Transcript_18298/m.55065 type:complete len:195 (-) Transcript_18298:334-918(-)